jgi:hypothetical protein
MQDATQSDDEDCTITGVKTQQGSACNIDGEPLFEDVLLAATQDCRSHRTGAYTDKEDLMLCDAWLHIGTDPINGAEQKRGQFWRRIFLYFHEHRKFKPDNFESDRNDVSSCDRFIVLHWHPLLSIDCRCHKHWPTSRRWRSMPSH